MLAFAAAPRYHGNGDPMKPSRPEVYAELRCEPADLSRIAAHLNIDLVLMFGSHASGRARPDSDLDIAVQCCPSVWRAMTPEQRAQWQIRVSEMLNGAIYNGEGLDTVILNRAESTLLFEVARHGVILYQRDEPTTMRFASYAFRRYDDDAHFRQAIREHLERAYLP